MENLQNKKPSVEIEDQNPKGLVYKFKNLSKLCDTKDKKDLGIVNTNFKVLKKNKLANSCILNQNAIETTSVKTKINSLLLSDQEKSTDGLIQSIDLSDLSSLSTDLLFGDCNCFEQASQLVDPSLKDSESTPISFNNNDLVQLLKFSLNDSNEDYVNKNFDSNNAKSFSKKCDNLIYKNKNLVAKDNSNFYEVHDFIEKNVNVNKEVENQDNKHLGDQYSKRQKTLKEKKSKKGNCFSIKKGRRYLDNFKQEVLSYTKNHTFKETALHFQINCNTITEWSREIKTLSLSKKGENSTASSNYKTDIIGTPISKTDIILLNDDISLETDSNTLPLKAIKEELLHLSNLRPDERFLKWAEKKRLQETKLTRQEVFYAAEYCLKNCPTNLEISSWFVMWVKRYNRVFNSEISSIETEKYIKYPNSFKLEVVLYAKLFTKNSAARVFNVCRRRMFDWFNHLSNINDSFDFKNENNSDGNQEQNFEKKDKLTICLKKDKTKNKIYTELHLWYQKMFFNGMRPTSYDVKEKAREIFSLYGMKEIKFSDGWLQKFCQRKNIKLRHCEDDQLLLWILTQFDNNVSLSHQEITEKSRSLIGKKRFKGSKDWTLRFLKRHKNLLQRPPTISDQLPRIAQEQLKTFWDNVRHNLISFKLKPENIGCMDEIPLSFNYPSEGISNMPLLRKTGFENCQGIVILSTLASGRILSPTVVFKGAGPKQLLSSHNIDILILYQEEGLITVDILQTWINDIWLRYESNASALVVDSFEPHRSKILTQILKNKNCSLHIIPDGCSSKFQPLDVEVTPVFKEAIRNQWKQYSIGTDLSSSKLNRRFRCPDRDTILCWVRNAYEKISRNPISITNGFKSTGLLM